MSNFLWTDESRFSLDQHVNTHNCYFYVHDDPKFIEPIKHTKTGISVWCGIHGTGLIGPFFFDEIITAANYQFLLKERVWPILEARGIAKTVFFQYDGAPAHTAQTTVDMLATLTDGKLVSQKTPIPWPPRSPDLTPPDFFLWGYLKDRVFTEEINTTHHLKAKIIEECEKITPEMCLKVCSAVQGRCEKCLALGGGQVQ
jgi:hypothetical protein